MKYLISGGAGFLGSHLSKKLLDYGHDVIIVDNLSSGTLNNIQELLKSDRAQFFHHDVCDKLDIKDKLDGIFNLACPASPIFYQKIPIETTITSVLGAYNLLRLADKNNCKILQTSTSEVYGDPEISPQSESYRGSVNCFGPRACYDEGKRAAETLFFDFKKQNNTDIRIVRIFNTYGPNMCIDDGRVVSNFIVQALRNEPITVYGNGLQTRSFCYVDDLIAAIMTVWNSDLQIPVNIGNPKEFTMLDLAKLVISKTNSSSELKFLPLPEDDPKQRRPDITLANSLGWRPEIDLDSGLDKTIEYFSIQLKSLD